MEKQPGFQECNDVWKRDFERELEMNCTDFYDFPFHPKILQYNDYLKYCKVAEMQTKCYIEKCGDEVCFFSSILS